jgi:hypothetical protein
LGQRGSGSDLTGEFTPGGGLIDVKVTKQPLPPSVPDPEAEEVALAGLNPKRVSLSALRRAELMWSNGDIPAEAIATVAERLTVEEIDEMIARQEFMDYLERDLPE